MSEEKIVRMTLEEALEREACGENGSIDWERVATQPALTLHKNQILHRLRAANREI